MICAFLEDPELRFSTIFSLLSAITLSPLEDPDREQMSRGMDGSFQFMVPFPLGEPHLWGMRTWKCLTSGRRRCANNQGDVCRRPSWPLCLPLERMDGITVAFFNYCIQGLINPKYAPSYHLILTSISVPAPPPRRTPPSRLHAFMPFQRDLKMTKGK